MENIKFYGNKNSVSATIFDDRTGTFSQFFDSDTDSLLDILNRHRNNIEKFYLSGKNLHFKIEGLSVEIPNIKEFKNDKRFRFIFEEIEKRHYKFQKKKMAIGVAVSLATILSVVGITTVNAQNNSMVNTTYSVPTSYYEDADDVTLSYEKDNVVLTEDVQTTEATTKTAEKEEMAEKVAETTDEKTTEKEKITTTIENELGVGSKSDSEKLEYVKEHYGNIIEKYSNMYGLDSDLMCAIATQERGKHSSSVDSGGAIGIMQIQVEVWDGHSISAYNYNTEKKETQTITLDKLKDVDFNIKIGCMIFQMYLNEMKDNIYAAIQSYNMGPGSVKKIIKTYAFATGKTYDDVINNPDDIDWLDFRNSSYPGDPDYVEHVSRYLPSNSIKK